MDRTTETAGRPAAAAEGGKLPRRSPLSRLSFGHVVMISAGLLAFLLNVLIIRDGGETVEVSVAAPGDRRRQPSRNRGHLLRAGGRRGAPFRPGAVPAVVSPLVGHVVIRDIARDG